jgi:hypothetical protein
LCDDAERRRRLTQLRRGDEVTGEGWLELQSDGTLIGEFAYDNGDESTLKALPW